MSLLQVILEKFKWDKDDDPDDMDEDDKAAFEDLRKVCHISADFTAHREERGLTGRAGPAKFYRRCVCH